MLCESLRGIASLAAAHEKACRGDDRLALLKANVRNAVMSGGNERRLEGWYRYVSVLAPTVNRGGQISAPPPPLQKYRR